MQEGKMAIEAILFAATEPVSLKQIAKGIELSIPETHTLLQELQKEYVQNRRGICILQDEKGYYMHSNPEYQSFIEQVLFDPKQKKLKLSQQALEVLCVIALYEPVTKEMVRKIRDVDSNDTMERLMKIGFIEKCGTISGSAHQGVYRTTKKFLETFHLNNLEELAEMIKETQFEQDFLF